MFCEQERPQALLGRHASRLKRDSSSLSQSVVFQNCNVAIATIAEGFRNGKAGISNISEFGSVASKDFDSNLRKATSQQGSMKEEVKQVKGGRKHFVSQISLTPESQWVPIFVAAWTIHFLASILVLCYGCYNNHGER